MNTAITAAVIGFNVVSAYNSVRAAARRASTSPIQNFKKCAYCGVTSDRTNRTKCPQCGAA